MEIKESEDHGGSMMGLKLKVRDVTSNCVEYCDEKQTDDGRYVKNLVGMKTGR